MTAARWLVGVTTLLLVVFVVDLRVQPGGEHLTRAVDDLAQLVAAAAAGGCAVWRALRLRGRTRLSWALIGLGATCWALGELIWCYYELIAGTATPFPSAADVGYLLFPVAVGVGIALRPSRAFAGRNPLRIALDVVLVLASLFVVSWTTTLGEVYRGGADSLLGRVVALAYPGTDIALLAVVLIVLSYANTGRRTGLILLGVGLVALAVADSCFAYLTAIGRYHTGNLIDACWLAGFLILAASALLDDNAPKRTDRPAALIPRAALLLPYVPAPIGILVAGWRLETTPTDKLVLPLAAILVFLLAARQVLILLDNQALLVRITHQSLHDPLTGLANRVLFTDRLERAVELHHRDQFPVAVMIIDLDDFKAVNDRLGHPAGDELLIEISLRLRDNVRRGDTVARLGGDEFAVLIEDGGDPTAIAARITAALRPPINLGQHAIPVRCSIGSAAATSSDPTTSTTDLMRHADLAMYHAKRSGKGRLATFSREMIDLNEAVFDLLGALPANTVDEQSVQYAQQAKT